MALAWDLFGRLVSYLFSFNHTFSFKVFGIFVFASEWKSPLNASGETLAVMRKPSGTKMDKRNLILIHCFTPLFLGGLLYISFRSSTLKMFTWFKYVGIENYILYLRQEISNLKLYLPQWIYFSLPDGLWVYSFTSALLIYWNNETKKVKFWLSLA